MSKKIIAGALAVGLTVSAFAFLAVPTFAASTSWQEVNVTPATEFVIGGNTGSTTTLNPTISAIDSKAAGAMTISALEGWELTWQAVTGNQAATSTSAAPGVRLGTSGFASSGGYAYSGLVSAVTPGANNWGATLAGASGAAIAGSYSLGVAASIVATGSAVSGATVTATYAAGTDGSLGLTPHFGTIYYNLVAAGTTL